MQFKVFVPKKQQGVTSMYDKEYGSNRIDNIRLIYLGDQTMYKIINDSHMKAAAKNITIEFNTDELTTKLQAALSKAFLQ